MTVRVDLDDLAQACEYVSAGRDTGTAAEAFISRADGRIHWRGEGIDDDMLPDDIDDDAAYVCVPGEREFDLGSDVAIRFAEEQLPDALDQVEDIFHRRGAFSKFKTLLGRADKLDAWYAYEESAKDAALAAWAADHGFLAVKKPRAA